MYTFFVPSCQMDKCTRAQRETKKSYIHAIKHFSKDLKITLFGCVQRPENFGMPCKPVSMAPMHMRTYSGARI
jgi:hypothetical protein